MVNNIFAQFHHDDVLARRHDKNERVVKLRFRVEQIAQTISSANARCLFAIPAVTSTLYRPRGKAEFSCKRIDLGHQCVDGTVCGCVSEVAKVRRAQRH